MLRNKSDGLSTRSPSFVILILRVETSFKAVSLRIKGARRSRPANVICETERH